jgi:pilus assembly protein CpaB
VTATRPGPVLTGWRSLRRAVSWHRRLLAAGLAAGAVASGLHAVQPPPATTVTVLAAAQDLPGGHTLAAADVRSTLLPPDAAPPAALPGDADVTGRVLAGPVTAGEPLTDVRFVGPSLVAGYGADVVAVPVRIADATAATLVRPGDLVDVLAASSSPLDLGAEVASAAGPEPAVVVASAVRVIAVLGGAPTGTDSGLLAGGPPGSLEPGALVLLAASPAVAARLAGAQASARLSLTLRAD